MALGARADKIITVVPVSEIRSDGHIRRDAAAPNNVLVSQAIDKRALVEKTHETLNRTIQLASILQRAIPRGRRLIIENSVIQAAEGSACTKLGINVICRIAQHASHSGTSADKIAGSNDVAIFLPGTIGVSAREALQDGTDDDRHLSAGESILVVEDQPEVRAMISSLLNSMGYKVKMADDASAARDILALGEQVDLLVTDFLLPHGLNGADVAEVYLRRYPDQKILFVSGYMNADHEVSRRFHGLYEFLGKPFSRAQLAQAVDSLLNPEPLPRQKDAGSEENEI